MLKVPVLAMQFQYGIADYAANENPNSTNGLLLTANENPNSTNGLLLTGNGNPNSTNGFSFISNAFIFH
ncbi:MAG TPA: hypothetical protein DCL61_00725 [Cyanobacteria bacterium UBA12227]|nr:hypothetical protein [Cyanobacteria bacterium UBA12227]HAX84883.1 hypothetical protein [Cyanobacteria bacterium UBA11370]HBY77304.1 hypothetical protein [Cyanobacteria bacterium UBA11148]